MAAAQLDRHPAVQPIQDNVTHVLELKIKKNMFIMCGYALLYNVSTTFRLELIKPSAREVFIFLDSGRE